MTFTITLCALAALMILGLPISVSLLISGMLGYMITIGVGPGINALTQTAYSDLNSFVIIAIPLYIYMGQLMLKGGAGKDLFSFAHRITRKLPGGLAIAATLASTIFAAISGSSTATAATIGSISIPEMRERGYPKRLSAGCVAVSGTLGILIPPSISFILYSLVTNSSVNQLFLAGIIPGLMLAGLFSLYSIYAMRKHPINPTNSEQSAEAKAPITFDMIASLLLIPVVLGGIYTGLFTPTEAAGVGVIYALLLTIFVKRSLSLKLFWQATMASVETSAMILMLIAGASVFGNTLSLLQVPQDVAQWIDSLNLSAIQFLILINILYLILGMFMDAAAAILVTVPILLPALQALDINLVWFGVILVINMEIGAVTPPVGMNLFVVKAICEDYTIKDVLV
ncbi:TRAP transporter large permease, partial [Marinomonas spartinae]|uniref:TRAP transporter large permease n=1 Tax=Marinomonas spartinae TaxID=1792290 RepID=UPI0018F220B9